MNEQTIRALNQLNRNFYDEQAKSWQASRQYIWPSWEKFIAYSYLKTATHLKVADVGCGTGRFAKFITEKYPEVDYHGLDLSPALLELAQKSVMDWSKSEELKLANPKRIKFTLLDIVELLLNHQSLLKEKYDLIVVFGVYHHLPSQALRRQFLSELRANLLPGGEIWLTTWQPDKLDQKEPKKLDSAEILFELGLKQADLDPGDSFVGWKNTESVRYVHWLQETEEQELKQTSGLELIQTWLETSPGERGNQCWLWRQI